MPRSLTFTVVALVALTALTAACGKADEPPLPKIVAPATTEVPAGSLNTPTLPSAPLPDPVVSPGATALSPQPGQAGDTSSPAFKNGGKADPHK